MKINFYNEKNELVYEVELPFIEEYCEQIKDGYIKFYNLIDKKDTIIYFNNYARVEIIGEYKTIEEDKKIEKIEYPIYENECGNFKNDHINLLHRNQHEIVKKLYELIDIINEMRDKE